LVIDDSISVRKAVERLLGQEGYAVESVRTLQAARQRWSTGEPFQVVIADAILPDGDLVALAELLRVDARHAGTPVLCLTQEPDERVKLKTELAGAAAMLRKPFAADELLGVLSRLVSNVGRDGQSALDPLSRAAASAAHHENVRGLYEEAADWRGLIFAILLSPGGQALEQVRGRDGVLDEDRVEELQRLAVELASRLRGARMSRLTTEGDDAMLFVDRLEHGEIQLLAVSREVLLGMGRLYAKRLAGGALQAEPG
jgi:CheY-like chemotaxis protein